DDLAVEAHSSKSLAQQLRKVILKFSLFRLRIRRQQNDPLIFKVGQDAAYDLLDALRRDPLAADRAMGDADPRKKDAQVVVDLGEGSHGGTGILAARLLLDRDRWS